MSANLARRNDSRMHITSQQSLFPLLCLMCCTCTQPYLALHRMPCGFHFSFRNASEVAQYLDRRDKAKFGIRVKLFGIDLRGGRNELRQESRNRGIDGSVNLFRDNSVVLKSQQAFTSFKLPISSSKSVSSVIVCLCNADRAYLWGRFHILYPKVVL